jgi:hypothetical protein
MDMSSITTIPVPDPVARRHSMRELERWMADGDELSLWWDPHSDTCWLLAVRDGVEQAAPVPNDRVADAMRHPFLYLPSAA